MPATMPSQTDEARGFQSLVERGALVLVVFSAGDPGVENLRTKLAGAAQLLEKRPNYLRVTIEGADHSFTPRWSQAALENAIAQHLVAAYGG
jgi:hypothetical protein